MTTFRLPFISSLLPLFTTLLLIRPLLTHAQFVPPPTDLITKTGHANITIRYKPVPPGVCEQNPSVKSYSGYADVAPDQHIFFWFFEARNVDPLTAPLTVWINGGPGSSSMIGLFQELGPCTVNSSLIANDNPYSWSNASNMLFIDSPTQVGFSYSIPVPGHSALVASGITVLPNNTCPSYAADSSCGTYSLPDLTLTANSTPNAAPNMYLALQGFMGAFPEYSSPTTETEEGRDFFLTSESYGGHYIPIFSHYILQQNSLSLPGTVPINLKGIMIGNGWFNPLLQYEAYYQYTVSPGNPYNTTFFDPTYAAALHNNLYGPGNCLSQIRSCYATGEIDVCNQASTYCGWEVEEFMDVYAGRDEYDTRFLVPDPFPPEFYVDYLNLPEVQSAIGAYVNFTESNHAVSKAFSATGDDARQWNIAQDIGGLIERGIYVVIYYGDADYNCNFHGGMAFLDIIDPPPLGGLFNTSAGATTILTDTSTPHHPRGTVRQAGNFAFLRVYQAGHEVPFYQPELSLRIFERVVQGLDIAEGKEGDLNKVLTKGEALVDGFMEGNENVLYEVIPTLSEYDWINERAKVPKLKEEEKKVDGGQERERQRQQEVLGRDGFEVAGTRSEKHAKMELKRRKNRRSRRHIGSRH